METINETLPEKEFLPEAGNALRLSIWGNALSFLYMIPVVGFFACVAGIILSIIGLRKGRAGMDEWKVNKAKYHGGSFAKTLIAFILGIVGIVQGAILAIYSVVFSYIILDGGFDRMFQHMF